MKSYQGHLKSKYPLVVDIVYNVLWGVYTAFRQSITVTIFTLQEDQCYYLSGIQHRKLGK